MFLLDANGYARDPLGIPKQIAEIVSKCGGEVLASRLWAEQKLAYPINGQRKGVYWLTYIRLEGAKLVQFERACRLNDNITRNLTLKVDARLADTLVAHARGDVEETPKEEASAPAPAETAETAVT